MQERALLTSYDPGNLEVGRQLVHLYQLEIQRVCYLFTGGDQMASARMAHEAMLAFLDRLPRQPDDTDGRVFALMTAGSVALSPRRSPESGPDLDLDDLPLAPVQQHYQVDDPSTRLLEMLNRLEMEERVGLVLRDLSGLEEEPVVRTLKTNQLRFREQVGIARRRLRDAVSAADNAALRDLLFRTAGRAPNINLWESLEDPLRERREREESRRKALTAGVVAAALLVVVAGGFWLGGLPFGDGEDGETAANPGGPPHSTVAGSGAEPAIETPTIQPTEEVEPEPDVSMADFDIPDAEIPAGSWVRFFRYTDERTEESENVLYDTASGSSEPLDFGGFPSLISPDGQSVLYSEVGPSEDQSRSVVRRVIMVDVATREVRWERDVEQERGFHQPAFAGDNLYILESGEQYELAAYDLESGEETGRWPDFVSRLRTSPIDPDRVTAHLRATPDQQDLILSIVEPEQFNMRNETATWIIARYSVPDVDLRSANVLNQRALSDLDPPSFSVFNAQITPDGDSLVDVVGDVVVFRGADPRDNRELEIPFSFRTQSLNSDILIAPSNSGRFLYLLAASRKEVAVVDLIEREIERIFPLDTGGYDLTAVAQGNNPDQHWMYQSALSEDGERLYVSGAWTHDGEYLDSSEPLPLWTIDLKTGRVVNQWDYPVEELDGVPTRFIPQDHWLGRQGETLFATGYFRTESSGSGAVLASFDLETGDLTSELTAGDLFPEGSGFNSDGPHGFTWTNPGILFRDYYGRSPSYAGSDPVDADFEDTLPRVDVSLDDDPVMSGVSTRVEVALRDPVTGDVITGTDGIRFNPESTVSIVFEHSDEEYDDIFLVLQEDGLGRYQGAVQFPEAGKWDATLMVNDPAGDDWSFAHRGLGSVAQSLEGDDGRHYALILETDPRTPVVGEDTTLRLTMRDVETGDLIPEDVEILSGLPDGGWLPEEFRITVDSLDRDRGFASPSMVESEYGVWEGQYRFLERGFWEATVSFRLEDREEELAFDFGTIEVT